MRDRFRPALTYANVMATTAVFIALGGSATAAVLVTGHNVKDGSLTGADIKNGSIGSADIKDGALLARDIKAGQIQGGAMGASGLPGASGATGAPGLPGAPGAPGGAGREILFATVAQNGTLVNGQGVTGVTPDATPGIYHVRFAHSVLPSQCAATATSGPVNGTGANNGITAVVPIGPFDNTGASDNLIDVYERTLNGSVTLVAAPFHIIVAC